MQSFFMRTRKNLIGLRGCSETDLNLPWAHMSEGAIYQVVARMINIFIINVLMLQD